MSPLENPAASRRTPSYGGRLDLWAQTLGYFSAILCGLIILAIVATTVRVISIRDGHTGDVVEAIFMFLFLIPVASIPVGLICLVGMIVSVRAMRRYPSPEARTGLWLSLSGPVAVIACYAVCWGIMVVSGV